YASSWKTNQSLSSSGPNQKLRNFPRKFRTHLLLKICPDAGRSASYRTDLRNTVDRRPAQYRGNGGSVFPRLTLLDTAALGIAGCNSGRSKTGDCKLLDELLLGRDRSGRGRSPCDGRLGHDFAACKHSRGSDSFRRHCDPLERAAV